MEEVVLVDIHDKQTGTMEKMEAHRQGVLHRAFSVFVFNSAGEVLLHQRASSKYHSAGLWTNTCCSHPRPDETVEQAAIRRLSEEMGFVCGLQHEYSFIYKAELDQGLTEHELDHVFSGIYDGPVQPAPDEVQDYLFLPPSEVLSNLEQYPERYTAWFRIAFPQLMQKLRAESRILKTATP